MKESDNSNKALRVTMPDGTKYDVPARIIAENRARYYAEKETLTTKGERFDTVFTLEIWPVTVEGDKDK